MQYNYLRRNMKNLMNESQIIALNQIRKQYFDH